jgi:hypothetical protein
LVQIYAVATHIIGKLIAVQIAFTIPGDLIDVEVFRIGISGRYSSAVPLKSWSVIIPTPFHISAPYGRSSGTSLFLWLRG